MALQLQVAARSARTQRLPLFTALSGRGRKVKGRKKPLAGLALGLWLSMGTVWPASAQITLPQGSGDHPCDQAAGVPESGDSAGHAVMATIKGIDRQRGVLELETKDGRAVIATTPADTQSLQEGEEVQVCLEGEAIGGEERLAVPGR